MKIFVLDATAISPAFIGRSCRVLARARPLDPCNLKVIYPSERVSSARGLGLAQADAQDLVHWIWKTGTSMRRKPGIPAKAFVTLDGVEHLVTTVLVDYTDLTR